MQSEAETIPLRICTQFLADRSVQAFEAIDFIDSTSIAGAADVVVFAGDFNSQPDDLPHKIIKVQAKDQ